MIKTPKKLSYQRPKVGGLIKEDHYSQSIFLEKYRNETSSLGLCTCATCIGRVVGLL